LQITAAAVSGSNSEATMWRMVPDLDQLEQLLNSQQANKITITLRGIGEMIGDAASGPGTAGSWMDLSPFERDEFGMRRAYVNLSAAPADAAPWNVMDQAALDLAQKIAGNAANIEYFYNNTWNAAPPPPGKVRDGLGTTHHEAGTPAIGAVTDGNGRFLHIENAYAAGPATYPQLGSANPALTAVTLARRTADAIVQGAPPAAVAGVTSLLSAGLWMAGRWRAAGGS
jgi:choline dehydrogenase-like flavoprotein